MGFQKLKFGGKKFCAQLKCHLIFCILASRNYFCKYLQRYTYAHVDVRALYTVTKYSCYNIIIVDCAKNSAEAIVHGMQRGGDCCCFVDVQFRCLTRPSDRYRGRVASRVRRVCSFRFACNNIWLITVPVETYTCSCVTAWCGKCLHNTPATVTTPRSISFWTWLLFFFCPSLSANILRFRLIFKSSLPGL